MAKLVQDPWKRPAVFVEGMCSLRIMGPEGDVQVVYEPASQEQVDEVAKRVRALHDRGFRAFGFMAGEKTGALLSPDIGTGVAEYEKVIMAAPMAGG